MGKSTAKTLGQATTEYVLLLAIIFTFFLAMRELLFGIGFGRTFYNMLNTQYRAAFQYGNPLAKGPEEGGPEKIPKEESGDNFRIFLTPRGN